MNTDIWCYDLSFLKERKQFVTNTLAIFKEKSRIHDNNSRYYFYGGD